MLSFVSSSPFAKKRLCLAIYNRTKSPSSRSANFRNFYGFGRRYFNPQAT